MKLGLLLFLQSLSLLGTTSTLGATANVLPKAAKGVIQSCRGWRLNGLPEVKRFLMTPGNADAYPDLTVKYISGLHPELKLYDDEGLLMDKIDLARYKTDEIHDLIQERGLAYVAPKDETDEDLDDFKPVAGSGSEAAMEEL